MYDIIIDRIQYLITKYKHIINDPDYIIIGLKDIIELLPHTLQNDTIHLKKILNDFFWTHLPNSIFKDRENLEWEIDYTVYKNNFGYTFYKDYNVITFTLKHNYNKEI